MAQELQGKRVAFLAADAYEESELKKPWQALEDAGAEVTLVSRGRDSKQRLSADPPRMRALPASAFDRWPAAGQILES